MKRINTAIWLEKQCRWQINVQREGKRRTFTCSVKGREGKAICHLKADAWLDDGISDQKPTVEKLAKEWQKEIDLVSSTGKRNAAKSVMKVWVVPALGNKRVSSLCEQDVQDVINKAHKAGKSKATLQDIRGYISLFLKYARKKGITKLRIDDVEIPKDAKSAERIVLQPEDIKKLFAPNDNRLAHMFRLYALLGLRPGEMIALKWDAITGNALHIKKSINIYKEETNGKNKNALRSMAIPELAAKEFEAQREQLKKEGIISPYVFPTPDGKPMIEYNLRNEWYLFRDSLGMSKATLYGLRHTHVSIFSKSGVPIGILKDHVGHSKTMDTLGVYSHEQDGDKETAKTFIDKAFEKILK